MDVEIIKETVNGARRKEIYEMGIDKEFEEISIYILTPESTVLTIHGNDPIEKYINTENIPSGVEVVRIKSNINSGVVLTDEKSIAVRIFAPLQHIFKLKSVFNKIAFEVLSSEGISVKLSSHRPGANDLVFIKEGIEKKFCGCAIDFDHKFFSFFFCFDFNYTLAEALYKIDTPKMKKRGDVKSISDIVGGLREINPNIGPELIDDIIEKIILELNPEWKDEIS